MLGRSLYLAGGVALTALLMPSTSEAQEISTEMLDAKIEQATDSIFADPQVLPPDYVASFLDGLGLRSNSYNCAVRMLRGNTGDNISGAEGEIIIGACGEEEDITSFIIMESSTVRNSRDFREERVKAAVVIDRTNEKYSCRQERNERIEELNQAVCPQVADNYFIAIGIR